MTRPRRLAAGTLVATLMTAGCTSLFGDLFDGYAWDRCTGTHACPDASSSTADGPSGDAKGSRDARTDVGGDSSTRGDSSIAGHGGDASDAAPGAGGRGGATGPTGDGPSEGAKGSRDARAEVGGSADGGRRDGPPSCSYLADICGVNQNDDCCASDVVPGGTFVMGRNPLPAAPPDELDHPEHSVSISTFRLDRYEVTVGRFRSFIGAYDAWPKPKPGDGASPGHPGSWDTRWTAQLPVSGDKLRTLGNCETYGAPAWTDRPANHESYAMNCLPWIEAFAFCLWDGGRLPTEAEWEYTAAGGSEQRTYPWGNDWHSDYVNTSNYFRSTTVGEAGGGAGRGRWGQSDLAGNLWEWTSDAYVNYEVGPIDSSVPKDPATPLTFALSFVGYRPVLRGGSWWPSGINAMSAYHRATSDPVGPNASIGVRCARETPAGQADGGVESDASAP